MTINKSLTIVINITYCDKNVSHAPFSSPCIDLKFSNNSHKLYPNFKGDNIVPCTDIKYTH